MSDLKATHIFEIRINAEGDKLCLANPSNDDSGAYRIAGPKAWGGSNLIEDIEIRESDLVTYIKEYAPHLAPIIASDPIDKLQARVQKLEQHNVELAATVEQLRDALKHLHHNAKASGAEMGLALDVAEEALESTPRQNLNAVKREVARGAFIAGATDAAAFISQQLDLGKTDIDLDAGAAADKYVKTNYPSDKE